MNNHIVDARGQTCPRPLILTKKALKAPEITGTFTVLIDRENPKNNIQQLLTDNAIAFRTETLDDCFHIHVDKPVTNE